MRFPPILSKPSNAAPMAIGYVTVGALVMVWNAIWYVWILNHHDPATQASDNSVYWCAAFFFTGLTLFVIGLALGRIGRAARTAELPPDAPAEQTAQPAVAPAPVPQQVLQNGQAVQVLPNGQVAPAAVAPVPAVPPIADTAHVR